jgi:hypothetical protein
MTKLPFKMYVLDADNHVVEASGVEEWGCFMENERKHIGWTGITSECHVSTIFIGIDHRVYGDGPPILFETMIFGGPQEIDERTWRYANYDDAVIGHKMAVAKARAALGQKVKT